jgi:glycerophosphoryl diester phosphodiesterase
MSVLEENRWLVDTFICHRGYHSGDSTCPENSMKAFERAAHGGFAVELDVQLLADNEIVVFHDANTFRMTGVDRVIEKCEADQVRKMRLLGSDQSIPLFDGVLDLIRGDVPLLIELKNFGKAGMPEQVLFEKLEGYRGQFAIQSFNPRTLVWLKARAPLIPRGQLSGSFEGIELPGYRKLLVRYLLTNPLTRPHFISYEAMCLPSWITSTLSRKGVPILGWTVQSHAQYQQVMRYCDNIIFEDFDPHMTLA